jgi:ADP-ribose pyrophosphatase
MVIDFPADDCSSMIAVPDGVCICESSRHGSSLTVLAPHESWGAGDSGEINAHSPGDSPGAMTESNLLMPTVKRETLGEGKFLRLVREGRWEFAERNNAHGAVAVIAVTKDPRLVLTEQFRPAVRHRVIDLPAGLAGDIAGHEHEALAITARRELEEEAGFTAKSLKHVADCTSSPGLSSEMISYFLAKNITQISDGGGVDHEQIDVHTPSIKSIKAWLSRQVKAGKLIDAKVYLGLYFAGARHH